MWPRMADVLCAVAHSAVGSSGPAVLSTSSFGTDGLKTVFSSEVLKQICSGRARRIDVIETL